MNILKAYMNTFDAKCCQEQFELDNFYQIKSSDRYGKVSLLTGHSVHFRVITTLEDCHKIAGHCFSWVEYNGWFEPDIKQWIASRIRDVS